MMRGRFVMQVTGWPLRWETLLSGTSRGMSPAWTCDFATRAVAAAAPGRDSRPRRDPMTAEHGGAIVADVLSRHGVQFLFALCGGHISPILTGCQERGIRVVDVRDEGNAVFAADAAARMTGIIGAA